MKLLDLSLSTPEENLALDEALLEAAEKGEIGSEVLRFWESSQTFVVLGYSNKAALEANLTACQKDQIPVLRRISGGGTVLQGPGCLNYSLILRIPEEGPLTHLIETNHYILEKNRGGLIPYLGSLQLQGTSDLTIENLKFSGNAQRRKKFYLLYHGTLLYKFKLNRISRYLQFPSRQPEYRRSRSHTNFVTNISLAPEKIREALQKTWKAEGAVEIPRKEFDLALPKYSEKTWNFKF